MHYPVFEFAFVVHIAPAIIVQFGLVIDLRFVVLFGDLGLQVGVSVLQVE